MATEFGVTTDGGTDLTLNDTYVVGYNAQTAADAEGANLDAIHIYTATVGDNIKAGFYSLESQASNADPEAKLFGGNAVIPVLNTWNECAVTGITLSASIWYHLCARVAGATTAFRRTDSGGGNKEKHNAEYTNFAAAWFDTYPESPGTYDWIVSIHGSYTTVSGTVGYLVPKRMLEGVGRSIKTPNYIPRRLEFPKILK